MKLAKRILSAALILGVTACLIPQASAASYTPAKYDCSRGYCVKITAKAPVASAVGVNYTPVSSSTQENQLLGMMNRERAAKGLKPYVLDSSLSAVAAAKARDMIDNKYFAHQSPKLGSVRDMLKAAGIPYRGANENIARYGSLTKAFTGLMSSQGHRNNIMSRVYTHVGLAVTRAANGTLYIVQVFIR